MNIFNETVSFVANGISYDIPMMRKIISNYSEYNNLHIEEVEPQVNLSEDRESSDDERAIIDKLKREMPIAIFSAEKLFIAINNNESLLSVSNVVKEKDENVVSEVFETLLKANINKFSDLDSVVLTYTRNVNAKNEKLKLLNEQVEDLKDWHKNKTFILTIPFDYDDYIVSIKIQKLIPRNKDSADRAYQFNAIFNFNFKNISSKQEYFRQIIQNYNDHVYSHLFIEKYNEFMGLKYDTEK